MSALSLIAGWEELNNAYLAAGLASLRECVEHDADPDALIGWWEDPQWNGDGLPPALELLGDQLGMSRFERLTLLLAAATELDPAMAARYARASGDPGAAFPTFGLALARLPGARWDAVSPHRPLRHWRLIEVHQSYGEPLTAARLRADERIVGFIKGLNALDDRLGYFVRPVRNILGEPLPPSHDHAVEQILVALSVLDGVDRSPIVELVGVDPVTHRGLAASAVNRTGHQLYELRPDRLPQGTSEAGDLMRLWERETLLLPLALYIDVAHLRAEEAPAIETLLEDAGGPVLVGCREPWPLRGRSVRIVDVGRPTAEEQQELWEGVLGEGAGGDEAAQLAAEFDLSQVAIRDAAALAARTDRGRQGLWAACRAHARPRLDALAQRIEPIASWEDIVLADEELVLLRHLVDQVRGRSTVLRFWGMAERIRRGSATTALFAGPSGTGKTLAAEVVANDLGLDLYRIDLAGVVSKYIGETERNLRRVFDAAEEGGVLLFFDEADALFGKRSEVKDSHDRYANIEVNYLLQRMEEYGGVAILASNQRHALDPAFLRRLRFVVPFPFPSPSERAKLWTRVFPAKAPVQELDIERLARIAASGGMIRNIALNAAYCAAGRAEQGDDGARARDGSGRVSQARAADQRCPVSNPRGAQMKVDLRIERLVLDGVELTRRERAALASAIKRELVLQIARRPERLPRTVGFRASFSEGRADAQVEHIGREVAAAVHSSLPQRGATR